MPSSSTSSSDSRNRHRIAVVAGLAAVAALWASASAVNGRCVAEQYEHSTFELLRRDAERQAGSDSLVLLLGTSQTRRSIDPVQVGAALADADRGGLVYNFGMDGTHAAAFPYFVREALERGRIGAVVMELGWISHDQYQGIRFVRQWVDDPRVLAAVEGTRAGARYLEPNRKERRFAPLVTGRRLRDAFDARKRHAEVAREVAERARARGWTAFDTRKQGEALIEELESRFAEYPDFVQDAFVAEGFVEAAQACRDLCAERGVPFLVYVPPFNRSLAPRVPVLRHFDRSVEEEVLPSLERAGITVLRAPQRFHEASLFSDHVHLHRSATEAYSRWFGERLAEALKAR